MKFLLAQMTLDDFYRSTRESLNEAPSTGRIVALLALAGALLIVLAVLHVRYSRQAVPKTLNHQGRLTREVGRSLSLKSDEVAQLTRSSEEQRLASPLVLLLCPSLLARTIANKGGPEREVLLRVAKRLEQGKAK
ncbi:MAG: hypothetical protein ABSH20_06525 [Tepidisphaeraceae bacterium]|jgi:hypothetical protein